MVFKGTTRTYKRISVFSTPNEKEKKRNNENKSLELNFNKSVVGVLT